MVIPAQTFAFYYLVTVSDGTLQTDGTNYHPPVVENLIDDLPNGPSDDPAALGDVFKDQFNGYVDGAPTGSATYLGLAFNAANDSSGILVFDHTTNLMFYLTNTALTDVSGSNNQLAFQLQQQTVGVVPSDPIINSVTGTPSQTFASVYSVTYSGGILHTGGSDLTGALNDTVTDIPTGPNDNTAVWGDVFNDQLSGQLSNGTTTQNAIYLGLASDAASGSSGILVQGTDGIYYYLTNDTLPPGGVDLAFQLQEDVICFMPGTMIRTPEGEQPVEALKSGDLVVTSNGRAVPVRWIGRQTVSMKFADPLRVAPIRIKAGALEEAVPARDLLVSADHAILLEGLLCQAGALVNGTSIVRESNVPDVFTYYHVEVDDHSLILAENVPAETFIDNVDRLAFDNWNEHVALYPEGKAIVEMPYPRAKAHRQVPRAILDKLAARGLALYGTDVSSAA